MRPGDTAPPKDTGRSGSEEQAYDVRPVDMLLMGAAALASGALVTASLAYKHSEKQLAAEGIDPRIRRAILPHALKAVVASLCATCCVAGAGFYALRGSGLIAADSASLPPPREALRLMLWGELGRGKAEGRGRQGGDGGDGSGGDDGKGG